MSLKSMISDYTNKEMCNTAERNRIKARIKQREEQIKRLKTRLDKVGYVSWIDNLLEPIAKAMVATMPDRHYEILGPFGMTAETSIHFYKNGVDPKKELDGDNCRSITFRPRDLRKGELSLVDYTRELPGYLKGSIGEMSGLQYPTVPMGKSIDELLQFMSQQETKKKKVS